MSCLCFRTGHSEDQRKSELEYNPFLSGGVNIESYKEIRTTFWQKLVRMSVKTGRNKKTVTYTNYINKF
jgi:hypothetical protein